MPSCFKSSMGSAWRRGGLLLLALLPGAVPPGLHAQTRAISLDRFDAQITVREDGSFDVVETLDVRFQGSWNGVFRDLSTRHVTAEGRTARLRYELGEVTDDRGRALEVDREGISGGRRLRIWVPDAADAVRTVVIRYRVRGGLRFFDEGPEGPSHDELYWNATGSGWEGPIRFARVRVRLPEGAAGVDAWGYTGRAGATEQAVTVTRTERGAEIAAERELRANEGLTVSVVWDAGVVDRPGAVVRSADALRARWPFALPLFAFFAMFRVWTRRGRDPARRALMVQYYPPEDLSPAEVGTLVDHRAELHDITATLVDLAVRGYLTIEEKEKAGLLGRFSRTKEYAFHQRRPRSTWGELRRHERAYLEGLFPAENGGTGLDLGGLGDVAEFFGASFRAWRQARRDGRVFQMDDFTEEWKAKRTGEADGTGAAEAGDEPLRSVDLSDLQDEFHVHLARIRKKIYARLKERGFYERRPDSAPVPWIVLAVLLGFAAFVLAMLSADGAGLGLLPEPLPIVVGFGLSAALVLAFGLRMGVRTEEGVRALEEILGFQEFLRRVEAPQYARMITSPDLFEKYLPYAMALKAEDRWAKAFDGLYRQPPDWYRGSSPGVAFQASTFASSMTTLSTQASRSMSSSPGGSSGSGGGGSSGGGSGGGGGGGF